MFRRRSVDAEPASKPEPHLSFGSWDDLPEGQVIQVCHPGWRGVRTVAYSFRTAVVESADLSEPELADRIVASRPECVVIQGWPPGAEVLAARLSDRGIRVKCVLHSSAAQHGAEAGEAFVVDRVLELAGAGTLHGVGMAKKGLSDSFSSLGFRVDYVPNRAPVVDEVDSIDLGTGDHYGVFAEPFWRKNVTTQLLAVSLLGGTAHVMRRPENGYLSGLRIVEHGELPYESFVAVQGSVDLNLYVTLSECHPSTPQESYLCGVPCLMSRTSAVFRTDDELWDLTTVDELDNPVAIAEAARRLKESRDEAVGRARTWIAEADRVAEDLWSRFVSS